MRSKGKSARAYHSHRQLEPDSIPLERNGKITKARQLNYRCESKQGRQALFLPPASEMLTLIRFSARFVEWMCEDGFARGNKLDRSPRWLESINSCRLEKKRNLSELRREKLKRHAGGHGKDPPLAELKSNYSRFQWQHWRGRESGHYFYEYERSGNGGNGEAKSNSISDISFAFHSSTFLSSAAAHSSGVRNSQECCCARAWAGLSTKAFLLYEWEKSAITIELVDGAIMRFVRRSRAENPLLRQMIPEVIRPRMRSSHNGNFISYQA